jgi:hypothetical protein
MTKEEIDEAKGYFEAADAQDVINKYKDLAQEPTVQDDVSDLDTSLQDELLQKRIEVDKFIQQKIDKYNLPTFDLFNEITNSQITVIERAKAGLPVDLISLKDATDYLYKIVKDIEDFKKNDQARIDYNLTTEYLDAVYQDLTIDITYLVDYETAYKSGESLPTFEYPAESPVTEDEFRTETTISKGVTTETSSIEEGETVSSLTFKYTIDSIKTSLENINDVNELNKYRAELNSQLANIPTQLIPQISEMVKAKLAELKTNVSTDINVITIEKNNTLIAKNDIFINNLMFAPTGAILTVIKIDNAGKIAKLKYGNKSQDLTFDEIENYTTTMSALNNQIKPELEVLQQEDKDKVVISNDLAEFFIKDADAVDQAVNEVKGVDNIQDLEDNLLNNLEC